MKKGFTRKLFKQKEEEVTWCVRIPSAIFVAYCKTIDSRMWAKIHAGGLSIFNRIQTYLTWHISYIWVIIQKIDSVFSQHSLLQIKPCCRLIIINFQSPMIPILKILLCLLKMCVTCYETTILTAAVLNALLAEHANK